MRLIIHKKPQNLSIQYIGENFQKGRAQHPPPQEKSLYNGVCKVCGKLLPKGSHKKKLCGAAECLKKYSQLQAKKYYSDPAIREKRRKYSNDWYAKKKLKQAFSAPEGQVQIS